MSSMPAVSRLATRFGTFVFCGTPNGKSLTDGGGRSMGEDSANSSRKRFRRKRLLQELHIANRRSRAPHRASRHQFITGSSLGLVEFIFQSDELTACPAGLPNCGPLNIAPPANNPYRDITGLA